MELEQYAEDFRKQGIGVVAISYDPVSILKDFTERHGISFPLLSDRGSQIIQRFGILNTSTPPYSSSGTLVFGIPHPGTYLVNREGVVQSKYFETRQADRYTAPTILLREFGSDLGTRETVVQTDHLSLKYYSSRDVVRPGARITLVADVQLGPKLHVYAPTVENYIPIQFALDETPYSVTFPAEYPASEMLFLPAIKETVPVYHGTFRVTQDVRLKGPGALKSILAGSREIKISGRFRYQACDDKICYLPQTLPLEWALKVEPLERRRVPESLQHPAAPAPFSEEISTPESATDAGASQ